jgi:hypothetical protein
MEFEMYPRFIGLLLVTFGEILIIFSLLLLKPFLSYERGENKVVFIHAVKAY